MATLVRKLRKLTHIDPSASIGGEVQADALKNFDTTDNRLSVFEVPETGLDAARLAAAVAFERDNLDHVDYVVFDSALLQKLGIEIKATPGGTPHSSANPQHRDLQIDTGRRLLSYAQAMMEFGLLRRVLKPIVANFLAEAVRAGEVELDRLKPGLRKELARRAEEPAWAPSHEKLAE